MPPAHRVRSVVLTWAAAVMAIVGAGVVTGCGSPPSDRVPGPDLLDEFAPAMVGSVAADRSGFDTEALQVAAGEAIELTNDDDGSLRVQGRIDDDLRYDTGEMRAGDVTVLAFLEPGEVIFTLVDSSGSSTGDESGESVPTDGRSPSLTVSVAEAAP